MPSIGAWSAGDGSRPKPTDQKEEQMEKREQIAVGVIGTGGMGGMHAEVIQTEIASATLAAVADLDKERAEKVAEKSGAAVFADAEEMIRDEAVEAVVVASPDPTHAPLVKECLRL